MDLFKNPRSCGKKQGEPKEHVKKKQHEQKVHRDLMLRVKY